MTQFKTKFVQHNPQQKSCFIKLKSIKAGGECMMK